MAPSLLRASTDLRFTSMNLDFWMKKAVNNIYFLLTSSSTAQGRDWTIPDLPVSVLITAVRCRAPSLQVKVGSNAQQWPHHKVITSHTARLFIQGDNEFPKISRSILCDKSFHLKYYLAPIAICEIYHWGAAETTTERPVTNAEKWNLGSWRNSAALHEYCCLFTASLMMLWFQMENLPFVTPHPLILLGLFDSQVSFRCSQSRLAELRLTTGSSSCGKAWRWQQKAAAHTQQVLADAVQLPEAFPPWYAEAQGSSSRLPLIKQMFFKWFMLLPSLISPQKIVSEKPCVIIYSGIYGV